MIKGQWFSDRVVEFMHSQGQWPSRGLQDARAAHKIAIDDCLEYFYFGTDQEVWSDERDFPFLIPPYDLVWLEGYRSGKISSEVHGQINAGGCRMAALVRRFDAAADGRNNLHPDWAAHRPYFPSGTRHVLTLDVWVETQAPTYLGSTTRTVSSDGTPLFHIHQNGNPEKFASLPPVRDMETLRRLLESAVDPFLLALSFMNCKNATVDQIPVPRAERRRQEHQGRPVARYHVLKIDAIKRAVAERMTGTGEGLQRALHYCRGHFATYSDDHPLFGKYTGRFWRPAHIRGTAKSGAVIKDYELAR